MALDFGKLNFSVSFNPTSAFPIDARSYFESYSDAVAAAASAIPAGGSTSTYYYGQTLVVVENNKASFYIIQPDNTLSGLEGASGSSSISVNPEIFEYDASGNLSLKGFDTAALGTVLSVGPDGTMVWTSVYTKEETLAEIEKQVAAAAHLKRVVVESKDDIDPDAENADHYIYMVPSGLTDDSNKYYEYMVLILTDSDGVETRIVEKVGSWDVDLSNYITKAQFAILEAEVNTKVSKEEGSRLITSDEITKLAGLENSPVKSVDETNLTVDTNGKLSLKDLPISKVVNLDDILNRGQVTEGGYYLVSQSDKDKLNKLVIDSSGDLSISGTVNAENVQDLDLWITEHKNVVEGLSDNNLTDERLAILESAITEHYISSVDETHFEVSEGKLLLKDLPISKVVNLQDAIDAKADRDSFELLVSRVASNEGKIDSLYEYLTWGELTITTE